MAEKTLTLAEQREALTNQYDDGAFSRAVFLEKLNALEKAAAAPVEKAEPKAPAAPAEKPAAKPEGKTPEDGKKKLSASAQMVMDRNYDLLVTFLKEKGTIKDEKELENIKNNPLLYTMASRINEATEANKWEVYAQSADYIKLLEKIYSELTPAEADAKDKDKDKEKTDAKPVVGPDDDSIIGKGKSGSAGVDADDLTDDEKNLRDLVKGKELTPDQFAGITKNIEFNTTTPDMVNYLTGANKPNSDVHAQ